MKPKINPLWGYVTLALAVLTLVLCVIGANTGVLLVKSGQNPRDTAELFFESVVIGKYDAADACLENYGSLGLDRSPLSEQGAQEWPVLLASYDYSLVGEPEVRRDTAVQTVRFRYLDLAKLEEELETPLNAEAIEAAGEGENGPEPIYPKLEELLASPENYYTTVELAVTLHFADGAWRIQADEALLSALAGGK